MMKRVVISLGIILSLVGGSPAWSETDWIMWYHSHYRGLPVAEHRWEPMDTLRTRQDCELVAREVIQRLTEKTGGAWMPAYQDNGSRIEVEDVRVDPRTGMGYTAIQRSILADGRSGFQVYVMEYVCVPVGVNPQ